MKFRCVLLLNCVLLIVLSSSLLQAQEEVIVNKKDGGYLFTIESKIAATPVKSQDRTGTCWSFSTVSFMESELLRMGKGDYDLSEMFVVRNVYPIKAELHLRMHGNSTFGPGGTFHDVNNVFRKYGMVPESVYSGKLEEGAKLDHSEMDAFVESLCKAANDRRNKNLSPKWKEALNAVLDTYMGVVPEEFTYKGKSYTPQSFAQSLKIDPDEYIELSSFTHQPWYKKFVLEIPDNWDWNQVWNVPLDELVEVVNHALRSGYSVAWDADVSEKTFSHRNGVAVIPEKDWNAMNTAERTELFQTPGKEKTVSAELRQESFDNFSTTDDHLMHIVGLVKDQNGTLYYMVKNSWGDKTNQCGGYVYVSEAYFRYKTIHILLHQDGMPKEVMKKLK